MSKLHGVNNNSNSGSKLNTSKYSRSLTCQLRNSDDSNDSGNQGKCRTKVPKLQRRFSLCSNFHQQMESSSNATFQPPVFSIPSDSESELTSNTHFGEKLDYNSFADITETVNQLPVNTHVNGVHLPDTTCKFKPKKCTCDRSFLSKDNETPTSMDTMSSSVGESLNSTTNTPNHHLNGDTEVIDISSDEDESNKSVNGNEWSHLLTGGVGDVGGDGDGDNSYPNFSGNRTRVKRCSKWSCGPRGYRVLSLDGGGIRGLIIVQILRALEIASGKKVTELFDWIIGNTSVFVLFCFFKYKNSFCSKLI
uniref:PNPLA domain-containing protein n=1 Tax=Trichobilharzia regenti TaxID=157069 RepID=A0AA85JN63_TRIRE|nr:unnamed protein product [Trichobilharzia regenti]